MLNIEERLTDKLFCKSRTWKRKFYIRSASEEARRKFNGGSIKGGCKKDDERILSRS